MNISSGEIELWRSGETLEVPPELNLTISNIHGATSTNSYDLKMVPNIRPFNSASNETGFRSLRSLQPELAGFALSCL